MFHDLHNNTHVKRVISPVAVGVTGTGLTGKIIDRRGYGGVEFIIAYGTATATGYTNTITVLEGDTTGALTSVADIDLLGTEVLASMAAQATARTSGVGKNISKSIGYKGNKRYVTIKEVPTATAAAIIGVDAILHHPEAAPTNNATFGD